jgi:hypothetical protein
MLWCNSVIYGSEDMHVFDGWHVEGQEIGLVGRLGPHTETVQIFASHSVEDVVDRLDDDLSEVS